MLHFAPWKIIAIALTCALSILISLPNFFSKETVATWPRFLPKWQLNLGLDLRGGAHLLLAMDTSELMKDWLGNLREDVRKQLRDAKLQFSPPTISGNAVQVRITKPEDVDTALRELRKLIQPIGNAILGSSGSTIDVARGEGGLITLQPTEQG